MTNYVIETSYTNNTGIIALPYAAPDGTGQAVVKTAAASMFKVVRWTVRRHGRQPVLPHWDTGNGNDVLIRKSVWTNNPLPDNDMKNIWTVSGEYVYAMRYGQSLNIGLVCGWIPYGNPGQFILDGALFDSTILKNAIIPDPKGTTTQSDVDLVLNNPIQSTY